MDLDAVGKVVIHKKYGEGIIVSAIDDKWIIDFNGVKKNIVYDVVFGKILRFKEAELTDKYLGNKREKKRIEEERKAIHKEVFQCGNMFGHILELCKSDSKKLVNPLFEEELIRYFSVGKKMNVSEEAELRKALYILSEKPFKEYPVYPVIMINTHSREGERYYANMIMDDKGKYIELRYNDVELQEAINVIGYWCVINKQDAIRHATVISDYTEETMRKRYFEEAVTPILQKVLTKSQGQKYLEGIEGQLRIGYDFYLGYFYIIEECFKYEDDMSGCITLGVRSEFGNGTDVSIDYILPFQYNCDFKYHPTNAKEYLR